MANQNVKNNLLLGAAVAVGLLGTLTSILLPKRGNRAVWTEQAREVASNVIGNWGHVRSIKKETNKNLVLGGIAGSIIGITTALLLAPKSGSDLIKDLSKSFQTEVKRATATNHQKSHSKKTPIHIKQRAAASSSRALKSSSATGGKTKKQPTVKKQRTSKKIKEATAPAS